MDKKTEKKATVFEFTSYKFEPAKRRIIFNYETEFKDKKPLFFTETIILPTIPKIGVNEKKAVNKLLEALHIVLGISYYKFYCPPAVAFAKAGATLSKREANFWNIVYKNGLGEFFYKNKLDPKTSPKFPYSKNVKTTNYLIPIKNSRCLLGIGGGKDSIVVAELLKERNFDITAFSVQTNKSSELVDDIIDTIGIKSLKIKRVLDPKVFDTHPYDGHIPISAIYAFLGVLSAVLYKYSYVIVGNEYSSNFGNVTYKLQIINHQWSKSFEFEKLFDDYVKNIISPDISYFSLLRPFYEIRIVKMFSKLKKYFPYFSSCNRNFRINEKSNSLWCGECPKCVFVFTLLSAFLKKKELLDIFKKNLYQDKNLLPLFKDVLGFGNMKPFDCVGTFKEAQSAIYLTQSVFARNFIMRQIGKDIVFYPETLATNKETNIPEQFRFLGMEHALIVGYGKEGKITKKYLQKYYPKIKIGIADEKQGSDYLKQQEHFDIAIKTPGVHKDLVKVPYTTATNIFFSEIKGKYLTIGVTGSKGKSTTASLIFEIIKASGKEVQLLGNIGKPMLEVLLRPIKKGTIFVLELSSYQLDDLTFSPDISVVTNLFPEHMDYHKGLKNYYSAKKNIINFQSKDNYFIYNPENRELSQWLKAYQGKAMPFVKSIPVKDSAIPLLGEHNKNNIKAAITVAKVLNISDTAIKNAVKNFKALPHRLEFIGEFKGIKFYDDGSSTNPESAILAIKALKHVDTIFLGGEDRGYDFSDLENTIKKYKIENVVLFPDSGKKILTSTLRHDSGQEGGLNVLYTSSMQAAVRFAYQNTKKGSICLLSGASPSYSLWKNFDEKGRQFKKAVKKLAR